MTEALTTRRETALDALLRDPARLDTLPMEKLERLFDLHQRMQADAAKQDFSVAFNAAQGQMSPVVKRGKNASTGGSTFALAEDVIGMLQPLMSVHGFSWSISTTDGPHADKMRFVLVLRHTGGHEERHTLDAPVDDTGMKGNPTKTRLHGMASSYTYCERHLLCKVWGVQLVKDDDGNAASNVGPGAERITEQQAHDLESLLEETGRDRAKFLKLYGVSTISDLSAANYKGALQTLESARKMGAK